MDLELLKIKKAYRQNLAAEISGLEKQIRLLVERLERLEISPPAGTSRQPPSGTPQTGSNDTRRECRHTGAESSLNGP
jgi:hypothetical protein